MKRVLNKVRQLWNDESGQGAIEYILLLVVVVALVLAFKNQIIPLISGKMGQLTNDVNQFK